MDFKQLLDGSLLTTLEILYSMPDYPRVLQTFLWQEYDIPPDFPRIMRFLEFWSHHIDGKLHSLQIVTAGHLVTPNARMVEFYGQLH